MKVKTKKEAIVDGMVYLADGLIAHKMDFLVPHIGKIDFESKIYIYQNCMREKIIDEYIENIKSAYETFSFEFGEEIAKQIMIDFMPRVIV